MTDKAPPAWVVQVIIPAQTPLSAPGDTRRHGPTLLGAPSFKYFDVAIAAPGKATEATTKHLADAEDTRARNLRGPSTAKRTVA